MTENLPEAGKTQEEEDEEEDDDGKGSAISGVAILKYSLAGGEDHRQQGINSYCLQTACEEVSEPAVYN